MSRKRLCTAIDESFARRLTEVSGSCELAEQMVQTLRQLPRQSGGWTMEGNIALLEAI